MPAPSNADVKAAFFEALDLSSSARAGFLTGLAKTNAALAQAVEGLLAAHEGRTAADLEQHSHRVQAALSNPRRVAGALIADYQLLEEVGTGAFGSVWRARQVSLDRTVALKFLHSGRLAGPKDHQRLRAEAEAVARLDHPQIVPIYEVGEVDGLGFLSMKWVEGGTLAAQLKSPWPPRRAAQLMVLVARAMHHAHQRGLLHCDLKPSNVLLDAVGAPHVADFGIARRLDLGNDDLATQTLAGTPAYMAPEQTDGRELTVATDVWALGCIFYELLGARSAFAAETVAATLERVRSEAPIPLTQFRRDLSRDLATIVSVCLRKDPARRYASADALAEDLERWLNHEPITARRTGAWERAQLFCRRSPLAATLVGIVSVLTLLLAAVATWSSVTLGMRMREALLGQARATRLSAAPGARAAAFGLLERAATIRGGEDLRAEAVACSALSDVALEHTVNRSVGTDHRAWPDHPLTRIALAGAKGLVVADAQTGARLAHLQSEWESAWARWSTDDRWLLDKSVPPNSAAGGGFRVWDTQRYVEALMRAERILGSSADFHPDRPRLSYVNTARELVTIDIDSGIDVLRLPLGLSPKGSVCTSLTYRPDGSELAIAVWGDPPVVQFRRADDGSLAYELTVPSEPFQVAWLNSTSAFAVGCLDGRLLVYDDRTAAPRAVLAGHAAEVVDVIPGANGALIATSSWDETTRLWDALTCRELRQLSARALGFDATGNRFATLDASHWSLWRVEHRDVLRAVRAHTGKSPWAIALVDGSNSVASVGEDGSLLWQVDSAMPPRKVCALNGRAVAHVPGTSIVFAGGLGGLVRVDLEDNGAPQPIHPASCYGLVLAGSSGVLFVMGRDVVRRLDAHDAKELSPLTSPASGISDMGYLAADDDGVRVAAGATRDGRACLWDTRTDAPPREISRPGNQISVALSPDGSLLALSTNAAFELVRCDDLSPLIQVQRHCAYGSLPAAIAFSPDGRRLAFALANDVVRVMDVRSMNSLGDLVSPTPLSIVQLSFSPDGKHLATASRTNLVQMWDLEALARTTDRWR